MLKEDAILKELEKILPKALDAVLKNAERWKKGQRIAAVAVCLAGVILPLAGIMPLRIVVAVVFALYGLAFLTIPRKLVEAETFVLRGAQGEPRAVLASVSTEGGDTAGLMLLDSAGKERLLLSSLMQNDGYKTGLWLVDDSGRPRTQLVFDGTRNALVFADDAGDPRAYLRLDSELSSAFLNLAGKEVRGGVRLMAVEDGTPGFNLVDPADKVKTAMSISDGKGYLAFFTDDGEMYHTVPQRSTIATDEPGTEPRDDV